MTFFERITYFRQHQFVKNVASLQAGSFIGSFIQALAGIFIARLLQPHLFGIYAIAFSLASLTSILLGSGIQDAMTTVLGRAYARKDNSEIGEAFMFLIKMTMITAVISLGIVSVLPWLAGKFYHDTQIGLLAGVVVVASIISTFFFSFSQIAFQLMGRIKPMTVLIVADQGLRFGLSLLFVFWGYGLYGAVVGQLAGASIIFFISLFAWEWARTKDIYLPSLRKLLRHIKHMPLQKYFGYSVWVAVDRNMGNLYMSLPIVLVGLYLLTTEVTFFKLAFGFVNLALSLLGPISVLLNVEFPRIQVQDKSKMADNFLRVSLYALGLSTFLTVVAIIVSPLAFRILYGEVFMPSVKYVAGLIVYGALFGLGVGLGPMWRAINKVKTSITINLGVLGIGIPAGIYLIRHFGIWGAVVMVSLWFTISHFISFVYLYRFLKRDNYQNASI